MDDVILIVSSAGMTWGMLIYAYNFTSHLHPPKLLLAKGTRYTRIICPVNSFLSVASQLDATPSFLNQLKYFPNNYYELWLIDLSWQYTSTVALVVGVATDLLVAISLGYFLNRGRSGILKYISRPSTGCKSNLPLGQTR